MTKKIVFFSLLILFFTKNLFGCYLCSITDPTVYAFTKIVSHNKTIDHLEVRWDFARLYAGMAAQNYDKNLDGTVSSQEMELVKRDFYAILEDNNYNTTIYINNQAIDLKERIYDREVTLTYKSLQSTFKIKMGTSLEDNLSLMIDYIDQNGILAYFIKEGGLTHNLSSAFTMTSNIEDYTTPLEIKITKKSLDKKPQISPKKIERPNEISIYFAELLQDISHEIHLLIVDFKEDKKAGSLLFLLFISFVYGVIHAAGPGHGKSLVASYMLTHDRQVEKALLISVLIGFVHVFSAFLMTFSIYFILNEFFSKYLLDTQTLITKISGGVIVFIGLYLLYSKIKLSRKNKKMTFSLHKPTCECNLCNVPTKTTDLGVIISAGIIPCPGTVTIFIFTLSLQAYLVGFLAALAMSFGMSLIIFLTAALSIKFKTKVKGASFSKLVEYGSIVFIMLLGVFLVI